MTLKFEDLLALARQLPREEQERLVQLLRQLPLQSQVRDSSVPDYWSNRVKLRKETGSMTSVTVNLPDDLVTKAKAAGLLTEQAVEDLIRQALDEEGADERPAGAHMRQHRQLVRENGHLVVASLPGEKPITDAEVHRLLNEMEW